MLFFILLAMVYPDSFGSVMNSVLVWVTSGFGWAYVFFSFILILFTFGVIVSPIGGIRIGGKDAKPSFGVLRWFSISLCSGIGIGILFWGIGEPIYHLMQPPKNLDIVPASHEAALFAISQSALHWSIAQYCIYSLCGVAFALAAFNRNLPLSVMSGLEIIMPRKHYSLVKNIVHASCLFSVCCAVISSIGSLIMMTANCLSFLTDIPRGFMLNLFITVVSTVFFVASSTTGLKKGMSFLSVQNTRMFFIVLFYCFFCGPTLFILNMGTESFGYMLANFFRNSTLVSSPFLSDTWANSWIVIYMAWFFAYGPPIGLYLARLGKGRTVRQFLLMNVLAPTVFVYFWINTFGSIAIFDQLGGIFDVWSYVQQQGIESTVIAILKDFPFAGLLIIVFVIVTLISFVTLVDPMTAVLATLSTKGISAETEAPRRLKIVWGSIMGAVALAMVTLGGISSLRGMIAMGGVLMLFFTLAFCFCIVKMGRLILREEKT